MQEEFDKRKWASFKSDFQKKYGEHPSVLSALFMIGLSNINAEHETLTKEEKQDVIHVGLCTLLKNEGFYTLDFIDEDGWPHFSTTNLANHVDIEKQENYLRHLILKYFRYE